MMVWGKNVLRCYTALHMLSKAWLRDTTRLEKKAVWVTAGHGTLA